MSRSPFSSAPIPVLGQQQRHSSQTVKTKSPSTNPFVSIPEDENDVDLQPITTVEDDVFQNYVNSLEHEETGEDSENSLGKPSSFPQKTNCVWYLGDSKEEQNFHHQFDNDDDDDQNDEEEYSTINYYENVEEGSSNNSTHCTLAFDTNSSNSLKYFLNQNSLKLSQVIGGGGGGGHHYQSQPSEQLKKSLRKSFSSASFFSENVTSPQVANNSLNESNMNVASKKRGLFSRGSKTNSNTGGHNASTTSINDHHEENGKLKNVPSSPSNTSHHMNELDEDRFNGDGVMFQGKLIGHEYVAEARGEQMCQLSLKKLKIIQKALGGHKKKVNMCISFDGIKIIDAISNEEMFHHTVPQISFISRDETDTRAFGYVFGNSQTGHQFIGIKTKKEAMIVMSTIGQLFAITLKRKRSAEESAAAAAAAATTGSSAGIPGSSAAEEHLYHSVQDQPNSATMMAITPDLTDLSASGGKSTIRARIRHNTGSSTDNMPIPALPPPSEQHPRHHRQQQQQQQQVGGVLTNSNNRFATVGRCNDINNNSNFQNKQSSSASLINELDLFQPTIATGQNLGSSIDSSILKDQKSQNRLGVSYDWANFDDDHQTISQIQDDSTLNTISSISDTLTAATNNNTSTLNDSVTLVADNGIVPAFSSGQQQQPQLANHIQSMNRNTAADNKLNISSTTISSANFDGMDPFSDAFGADDPFSSASTTADISSNVFSAKVVMSSQPQQQQPNRPPSNSGIQSNIRFEPNKPGSFKNPEANSGSVPTLNDSFGSLSLGKQQQQGNNTFKSNVELSCSPNSADKYAVLQDISSISTSIFESIGGVRHPAHPIGHKENNRNKPPYTTNTPTPPLVAPITSNQRFPATGTQVHTETAFQQQSIQPNQAVSSLVPTSFCNASYQQQQQNPVSYGVNGVVVLPPLNPNNQNSYRSAMMGNYNNSNNTNANQDYAMVGHPTTTKSTNFHQSWSGKSFENNEITTNRNYGQPPKAEFDSMSTLSSTSSNASSTNIIQHQQQNNFIGRGNTNLAGGLNVGGTLKKSEPGNKTDATTIPLFQELDPLKSKSYSPSNFINDNRNRSPMTMNQLDSSLSSMNSSNSSLFNSRNCSTPSSLHRKSPQLLSQHSLPNANVATTRIPSSSSPHPNVHHQANSMDATPLSSNLLKSNSLATTAKPPTTTTTTGSMAPRSPYVMLSDLKPVQYENRDDDQNNKKQNIENEASGNNEEDVSSQKNQQVSEQSVEDGYRQNTKQPEQQENSTIEENINKTSLNVQNALGNHNGDHQSHSSSISSSSNSLLLNQSNISELKFDDVFEMSLLEDSPKNQTKNGKSAEKKVDDSSQQLPSERVTIFTPTTSQPTAITTVAKTTPTTATTSLSRKSSTTSCSTPPAVPPRSDIQQQHLNNNSNQQTHSHHHQHIPPPPPPLPPPHSNIHHSPYASLHRSLHYPSPPLPPPPPPAFYPPYGYLPPPSIYGHQDPYADPIQLSRSNSQSHPTIVPNHHHPHQHHRYWNSAYDWFGPGGGVNEIYGSLPRPLDYPPTMPPPPVPLQAVDGSNGGTPPPPPPTQPSNYGPYPPPDYFHHHPPPPSHHLHHAHPHQPTIGRPYSGGNPTGWHEYYQQQSNMMMAPPSPASFIQQQQQQEQNEVQPSSTLSSCATMTTVTNTLSSSFVLNEMCANQPQQPIATMNDNGNNSNGRKMPTTNNVRQTSSTSSSSSPIGDFQPTPTPPLPNPQRRVSSTSTMSSCSGGLANAQLQQQQQPPPPSSSSSSSNLNRSSSTSTVGGTVASMIPVYPPPPPPSHDPYYPHHYYTNGNDSGSMANKSSALEFATFNMNMEQMISKYHQPPALHHRNSPLISSYEFGGYGGPNYQSYHYQNPSNRTRPYSNLEIPAPPPYICGNSIGSNSSGGSSSGYSSSHMIHPSMMADNNNVRSGPWPPQQQAPSTTIRMSDTAWNSGHHQDRQEDNNTRDTRNLFDDNFASNFSEDNKQITERSDMVERVTIQPNNIDNQEGAKSNDDDDGAAGAAGDKRIEYKEEEEQQLQQQQKKPQDPQQIVDSKDQQVSKVKNGESSKKSPEERNIFLEKDDPFEDDFFKSSSS